MKTLIWTVTGDSVVVGLIVFLIDRGAIKLYPAGVLALAAMFVLNIWILAKGFARISSNDSIEAEAFGRRHAHRLFWALSVGIGVALLAAVTRYDARYLVQAIIGLFLLGYMLFTLRTLNKKGNRKNIT